MNHLMSLERSVAYFCIGNIGFDKLKFNVDKRMLSIAFFHLVTIFNTTPQRIIEQIGGHSPELIHGVNGTPRSYDSDNCTICTFAVVEIWEMA